MCAIVEEYADKKAKEAAKETAVEAARKMLMSGKFRPEDIIGWLPMLSMEEVLEMQESLLGIS